MLNVMIVDDEPLVRITLKSIIPWNKYDFYVLDEAENGKQCLDILETNKIDIIITDIKMPVIDGLELIKILKAKYPQILIIVLSAYEEFELVKKALLYGAEDYILKSELNETSTINSLLTVKEKYEENNKKLRYEMVVNKDISENINVLKESFIKELLFSPTELDNLQIEKKLKQFSMDKYNQDNILIILTISEKKPNQRILDNVIKNFINELFKKEKNFFCLITGNMEITIIRSYCEYKSEQKIFQMVSDEVNRLSGSIMKFLNIDVTTAVSKMFNSFVNLNNIYKKTKDLLNYSFPLGKGKLFFEQDFENKDFSIDFEYINTLSNAYRTSLDKLDFYNAKTQIHKITMEFIEHYTNDNYKTLKLYCKLLTAIVDKSIELSLYNHIFVDDINPYDHLLSSATIYSVENYLYELLEDLEMGSGIELKTQYGETVGKVMSYVMQNYHKDINLNKVADELNFNASYLSTKFKEITKNSFNEYLNTIRINNAKKLLGEGKYKLNQVSNMVGYNDQRYFCKIFKRIVGTTPREYTNSLSYL